MRTHPAPPPGTNMLEDRITPAGSESEPGAHHAELVPTRGSRIGIGVALTAVRTTIGRDRHCDIVLDDATASAHHAELHQREQEHYTLIDSGSLNGVYLNRALIQRAEPVDGDEIWVGKSRFLFRQQPRVRDAIDVISYDSHAEAVPALTSPQHPRVVA